MTVKVYAGISLRRGDDIHFGTLVRLGRGRAGITTDGQYRQGDFVEFQLELTGWEQTVTGIAEVGKADIRAPRLNRYLLRILEMRRADRQTLQEWYHEQRTDGGPESGSGSGVLDSQIGSQVPSRIARDLPHAARESYDQGDPQLSNWGTDRGLCISTVVEHQGSRRQALRAVLRAAYGDPLARKDGANESGTTDPELMVMLELSPPTVELRYNTLEAWQADWEAWLHQGLAFVRYQGPPPTLDQELSVRLTLSNRVDLSCPARVAVLHPTGFGLNLDLDPHQHESLHQVVTEDQPSPVQAVARAVAFHAHQAATTPIDRKLWSRIFGLEPTADPLADAINELVDPLEPLDLENPRERRQLDAILERADDDYLVLCDEVGHWLSQTQWRWPELEDRSRHAPDPMGQAAAFLVLAHVTRIEAVQALHKAAAQSAREPALVEIGPSGNGSCPHCRAKHGRPTTPAALTRRGLPPYHLGCECRVILRLDRTL